MDIRQLIITPDLLKLISETDEFKGTWKVTQNLTPDRLQSLRHVATIESIGSSTRIEGAIRYGDGISPEPFRKANAD